MGVYPISDPAHVIDTEVRVGRLNPGTPRRGQLGFRMCVSGYGPNGSSSNLESDIVVVWVQV